MANVYDKLKEMNLTLPTPPALKCVLVDVTFHSTIIDMR